MSRILTAFSYYIESEDFENKLKELLQQYNPIITIKLIKDFARSYSYFTITDFISDSYNKELDVDIQDFVMLLSKYLIYHKYKVGRCFYDATSEYESNSYTYTTRIEIIKE